MHEAMQKWYKFNFQLISEVLQTKVKNYNFHAIIVRKFPMPEKLYNYDNRNLLIKLGGLERYDNPQALSFYIDGGLERTDGVKMTHLFIDHSYNDLYSSGWDRLSYHVKTFNPNIAQPLEGDLLLDILEGLFFFLNQKKGV